MPVKQDMTLTVDVLLTGAVFPNGDKVVGATYSQASSNPISQGVIDDKGNINLRNMNHNGNDFNKQTDITFNLAGHVTGLDGRPATFGFPSDPTQAVTITKNGGGNHNALTPLSGNSPLQLIIDDEDNDLATYHYCLNVLLQTEPPITVQLDPSIVNR